MTVPKPPIQLSRVDPTYKATQVTLEQGESDAFFTTSQAHFADLMERYSTPILVLDLVKQTERKERERVVAREYKRAIDNINASIPEV